MELNEMKQVFKTVCERNNKILLSGDKMAPLIVTFKKKDTYIELFHYDSDYKYWCAATLKNIVAEKQLDGYILVLEGYIDKTFKSNGVSISCDCAIRTLYTPDYKETSVVGFKSGNIFGADRLIGREGSVDIFDCWGKKK